MKNFSLLIMMLFAAFMVNAASFMKMDFETTGAAANFSTWYPENVTVVDNPMKNAVNGTDKVLKWERSSEAWACLLTDNYAGSDNYEYMKFVVYHNIDAGLTITVEDNLNTDSGDRTLGNFDIPKGVWTEITVSIPEGGFTGNLAFRPMKGYSVPGDFYFDEIAFLKDDDVPIKEGYIVKMDFETTGVADEFYAWGADDREVVNNPNKSGLNGTNKVFKWRRDGSNTWAGVGTWMLDGDSKGYEKMRLLAYQNVADDLSFLVIHNANEDIELGSYAIPKGVWSEIIVPIPKSGLKPNVVFKPAGGTTTVGNFYIDEIIFFSGEKPAAPTTPAGLTSSDITTTSVALSWAAADTDDDVAKYIVYRSASGANETTTEVGEVTSGTTFNVTGLAANSTYKFAVKAVAQHGLASAFSDVVSATTLIATPDVPTGLVASNITDTSVTLTWTAVDNTPIAKYYVYYIVPGGTALENLAGEVTDGTTLNVTDLTSGSVYKFAVKAIGTNNQVSEFCETITVITTSIGTDNASIGITIANGLIVLSEAADVTVISTGGAVFNYGITAEANTSGLPAGIYIVKAGSEVIKFVK